MPRPTDEPMLSPVQAGRPTGISRAVLVVAALLAVAILKPWAGSAPDAGPSASGRPIGGGTLGPGGAGSTSATAAVTPSPDPNAITCTQPDGWRLVTLQQAKGLVTRTWLVVSAGTATGPADVSGPVAQLAETNVVGLGFCAEGGLGRAPGPSPSVESGSSVAPEGTDQAPIVGAWRRNDAGLWESLPVGLAASGNDNPDSGMALLYALRKLPVAGASAAPPPASAPTWPPGSYAFRVAVVTASGTLERWFRLDLVWPPVEETPSAPPASGAVPATLATGSPTASASR